MKKTASIPGNLTIDDSRLTDNVGESSGACHDGWTATVMEPLNAVLGPTSS